MARPCTCARPRIFASDPGRCHRCGRDHQPRLTASTWQLAITIGEIKFGYRPAPGVHKDKES